MVSERIAFEDYYGAHRVFKVTLALMSVVGVVLFIILFFGAGKITSSFNSLSDSVYAMRALAPALFFVTILSVFRGYFQGMQNMRPSAIIQITEQFFRVAFGLSLAVMLLGRGKPFAAAGATSGASIGSLAGLVVALLIYRAMSRSATFKRNLRTGRHKHTEQYKGNRKTSSIIANFLIIALPIMVGAAIMPIMNNIDLLIVTRRLAAAGLDPVQVRSMYGQLTGFAGPLINLPQVMTQAITISLVPTVVDAFQTGDREFLHHNVQLATKTTFIIALPCSVGMAVLASPIMKLLYMKQLDDAAAAAPTLAILACGIVFLSSIQTLTGILQGIERQFIPVLNLLIGAALKAVVTWFLTGIPQINIKGAALGTVLAYIVASILNFRAVMKYSGTGYKWGDTLGKPLIAALIMGAAAFLSYFVLAKFINGAIATLAGIAIGGLVYIICIFAVGVVSKEELSLLPKGEKLVKLFSKFLTRGK